MIKWIKNRLSKRAVTDEVEEKFAPVGVRAKPTVAVRVNPADTNVAGYNVDEAKTSVDNDYATTVIDAKTTGVDPYITDRIDLSHVKKPIPEK